MNEIDHWIAKYPADQKQSAVIERIDDCARRKWWLVNAQN